jgi:hypothetical protein
MGAKTCIAIFATAAIAALSSNAMAQKPDSPNLTGFFFTDLNRQVRLEYIPPGGKLPAFQMLCPKGTGKIEFDEVLGTPQDGPITLASAGKTLVLQGKKTTTARGTPLTRAETSTAEAVVLGLRDTERLEITAAGAHYVAQTTEGDRGQVGVFYTNCDEGDSL